ncbi:protein FAM186A [Marmota flaviventris]|uniref:protein FAM186A n=1 Tax=Marmota flaviventris TaxID=93162 RepID=UPI003A881BEA
MRNEVDSDSESEKENDASTMRRKPGSTLDVPVVSYLEIPFSVQTVISRIEKAQLIRAKEEINMQLTDILNNVQRIITRYTPDDLTSLTERRKSLIEYKRKRRTEVLEKVASYSKGIEVREKTLTHILAWLEEWSGILSEITAMDIDKHHHWIAQMQMLPEMLKAIENNVKTLHRISIIFLEERRKQKNRTQSRSTLWKSWKDRVVKRPATAHALKPDQMISDQFATNMKVSEIQDMLQELIGTTMFNKLENSAIKYISSTIVNLSKALCILSDNLKAAIDFPVGSMYENETREAEKERSQKIIYSLSEQNEMLQQRLKDIEEKFEQLIKSKAIIGQQLYTSLSTSSALKVLSEQSSTTKADDIEDTVDSILSKEFENILDESQRKGTKGTGKKWEAALSYTAQAEATPELSEQPDEDTTGDDISLKKGDDHQKDETDYHESQKRRYSREASELNLIDGKGEQKVSEDKPRQRFELEALEKKKKERKPFSQGKSKPSVETKSKHFSSTETNSQGDRSGTRSTGEQFRKVRPEQELEKGPISSEIKSYSSSESVGKEIKSKMSRSTEAIQFKSDFTSEPQKVEKKGKKHQILPGQTTSKEGIIEEKELLSFIKQTQAQLLVKSHSKVKMAKEDLGSPDGKSEQDNLELFQKAILAFLKEKIDNIGKSFRTESVLKEEKLLKKEEVEKLGVIKAKTEEYFQKVAETVTKILRKYKNIKTEGQVEEKSLKQKKIVSFMPDFQKSKPEISSILENESTDPIINNLIRIILTELERDVPTILEGEDYKEKDKKKQKEYLPEDQEKISSMRELQKPKQEEEVGKERKKQRTQKRIEQDGKENQRKRDKEVQQQSKQQQSEVWKKTTKERMVPLEKKSEEMMGQIQDLVITGEKDKKQSRGTEDFKRQRQFKEKDKTEKKKSVEPTEMAIQRPVTYSRRRRTLKHESQLYEEQKIQKNLETVESLPAGQSPIPVTPPTSTCSSLNSTLPASEESLTEYITLSPEQAQALGITLTPEQAQAQGITLTSEQAQALGITLTQEQAQIQGIILTPKQAQATGITLTPQQARAEGITLTPEQAQALGITLTPQQAQALGITLTPQQAQAQGITLTPQQAQALGITLIPEQAKAKGITLTPQQAQEPGITLTPEQAQARGITLTTEQEQALGITITPEHAQAKGITLTPQQVQAQGITLTPQQAQALGITIAPEQAQELGITLSPQQAQALGITLTPEQAQAWGITLTPEQAQALGITITPEHAQAKGITLTPQQAQALGITLTPQQAQARGITLTPEHAQALGITITPEQAQAKGITLTPEQAQALGMTLAPEQAQAKGITLTPQQAQAKGITLTPQQAQAQGITLAPHQAQALGITLTPEQSQAKGTTLTPQQAQTLGITLTPQQAQTLGITLTPEKSQTRGITLTPEQSQTRGITLTAEQAQALGITLTPDQAQALGIPLNPEQSQARGITLTPYQAQAHGITLTPQQAQAKGITLDPEQAQAKGITLTPEQAQEMGITLTPQQAQTLGITLTPQKAEAQGITLTPQQAQAKGITLTPQQVQAQGITLTPQQAQALGITIAPEQAQAQGITLTPQQAQTLGITLTTEQAQAKGITLTPEQAQKLGITLAPEQTQAKGITLTPEQAQVLGITLTSQQAQVQGINLTPQQAQDLGFTLTLKQALAQGITLSPQQAQDLGFTLTSEEAQAQGITLTPQQAQDLGFTPTPQQPLAQGITLTPQQAQAQRVPFTPQQAQDLGISFNFQQAHAQTVTLSPQSAQVFGATLTPEQVQALLPPLPSGQAVGITHTPKLAQALEVPLTEEQARKLRVSITPEKFQGASNIISLEQFYALRVTPSLQQAQALGTPLTLEKLSTLAPSTLRPFHELKTFFPTKQSIPSRLSPSPGNPRKGQGMHIPSGPGKLLAPQIFPTSKQILVGKGQFIPAQSAAPEISPNLGKLPISWVPPIPGQPLEQEALSSRQFFISRGLLTPRPPLILQTPVTPRQPLISRLPSTFGQIPKLRDPLSPGKPLVPEASSIPRELQESGPSFLEQPQALRPSATPEPSPYLQTSSLFGQQLAPWIIPGQVSPLWVPSTPRYPSTFWPPTAPEKPQGVLSSSVAQKRSAIISSLKSKPALVHPSAPDSKVSQAPFTTKKAQISEVSDTSEETKMLQDTSAMGPFETFQSHLTNYRIPILQTPHIDGQAFPPLMKPQMSLPSLITQLPKISQILPAQWDQKSRFPPIDKPWILPSVLGIKKPKVTVPPSSPQELEEKRYFVDVEAQRKNLILLNQATKTSGLPSQQHTMARNLIIETFHRNNIRLGYLFRKYIAYSLIQHARYNIIKQLKTIQNTGKDYEMQNLYIMLSRIDDYQKKVMQVWTEKQKSLEQKRSRCLKNMMSLFSQLQEKYKLNLSLPIHLITDKNQIPTSTEFSQQPFLELLFEEEKKSDAFKKFRQEDWMKAMWHADLSTSSYPITEKMSIHSLWAQLGGYPDIPRLLQLDIQSTFRKSLASIQSQ